MPQIVKVGGGRWDCDESKNFLFGYKNIKLVEEKRKPVNDLYVKIVDNDGRNILFFFRKNEDQDGIDCRSAKLKKLNSINIFYEHS